MDALESFRIEDEQSATGGEGYAGLDETLSPDSSGIDKYDRASSMSPGASSAGNRMALVAKIAVALVIVIVLAIKVPGYVKSTLGNESEARPEVFVNRALDILKEDGDAIRALEAVVDAMRENPGPENLKIADEVLDEVVGEIEALLNSDSWSTDTLKDASRLASNMVRIYPTAKSMAAKEEVDQESIDYRMWLAKIDPKTNTVTFQLNTSEARNVEAKRGDLIADRFKLISISGRDFVLLEDTKRDNRSLKCIVASSPK
jgi:hypothetical protein